MPQDGQGGQQIADAEKANSDEWDGDELCECEDLVYKLAITNLTDNEVKFKLSFQEKEGEILNLKLPVNVFKGKLQSEQQSIVALIPKIAPTDSDMQASLKSEVDKLDLTLKVSIEENKIAAVSRRITSDKVSRPSSKETICI